jgi:hypothetical protein
MMVLDWDISERYVQACIPGTDTLAIYIMKKPYSSKRAVRVNFDPDATDYWFCMYRTELTVEEIMADYDKMWEEILDEQASV